ncbi:MAG: hypothetical protein Sylvanvirus1_35 [Sylvanvirus sp.]|uniref:Uncharacterized protein n=1 Tax=Sylvanvirus sp. TaxID=2487774 RepID=A0A3G5AKK1_9VIRU|nr:MAG: hypothetical protein Sylvanvirus1_35 [Sylvanvirus sp.]
MESTESSVERNSFEGIFKPLRPFCDVAHFQSTRVTRVRADIQTVIEESIREIESTCEIDYIYPRLEEDIPMLHVSIVSAMRAELKSDSNDSNDTKLVSVLKDKIITIINAFQKNKIAESSFDLTLVRVSKVSDYMIPFLFLRWATDEEEDEAF